MAPISTFYPHLQLPSRASDPHKHLLRLWEDEGHQQDVVMKHSADVPKAPQTFPNLNSSLCHPHPAPLQGTPSQRLPCHLSTQLPLPETWAAPLSHFLMHLLILPPKSSQIHLCHLSSEPVILGDCHHLFTHLISLLPLIRSLLCSQSHLFKLQI